MLAASPLALIAFIRFEQRRSARVGAPLVELAWFRDGRFVAGILMALAFYMLSSFYLTFSVYLQGGPRLFTRLRCRDVRTVDGRRVDRAG